MAKKIIDDTNLSKLWTRIQQYINGLTGAFGSVAVEDVVPVEKGGTDATTPEQALENLGGISKTLLWENKSPTSEFPAQPIPLDLSEYDFVEIMSDLNGYGVFIITKHPVGKLSAITSGNEASGATNLNYLRRIECTTSGITFNDAYWNSVLKNNYLVPHRIYGIKGVQ